MNIDLTETEAEDCSHSLLAAIITLDALGGFDGETDSEGEHTGRNLRLLYGRLALARAPQGIKPCTSS